MNIAAYFSGTSGGYVRKDISFDPAGKKELSYSEVLEKIEKAAASGAPAASETVKKAERYASETERYLADLADYAADPENHDKTVADISSVSSARPEKYCVSDKIRPEEFTVPDEEEEEEEKNPDCNKIDSCTKCEHRKECKSFKDKENNKDNKEPSPFALNYFPKKYENYYQHYMILERSSLPDKKDENTGSMADYMKVWYNTLSPDQKKKKAGITR